MTSKVLFPLLLALVPAAATAQPSSARPGGACALLTHEEIRAATGIAVNRTQRTADPAFCVWDATATANYDVTLSVDDRPGANTVVMDRALKRGASEVSGVGTRAVIEQFRTPDRYVLWASTARRSMQLNVFAPAASLTREQVIALAKLVAARL